MPGGNLSNNLLDRFLWQHGFSVGTPVLPAAVTSSCAQRKGSFCLELQQEDNLLSCFGAAAGNRRVVVQRALGQPEKDMITTSAFRPDLAAVHACDYTHVIRRRCRMEGTAGRFLSM
jgi:hypothetical protein